MLTLIVVSHGPGFNVRRNNPVYARVPATEDALRRHGVTLDLERSTWTKHGIDGPLETPFGEPVGFEKAEYWQGVVAVFDNQNFLHLLAITDFAGKEAEGTKPVAAPEHIVTKKAA